MYIYSLLLIVVKNTENSSSSSHKTNKHNDFQKLGISKPNNKRNSQINKSGHVHKPIIKQSTSLPVLVKEEVRKNVKLISGGPGDFSSDEDEPQYH